MKGDFLFLCNKLDIRFFWEPGRKKLQKTFFSSDAYSSIYSKFKGIIYLFYYFLTRWSLRNIELKNELLSNKSVFFSSYFFNLDSKLAKQGVYHSRQWGELPAFINRYGEKTVHLENFIKSPEIPDPSIAKRMLKSFNQNNTQSFHIFLDGYLSLNILTKVITHYLKLNRRIIDYKIIKEAFNVKDSKLNLWPLLKDDWFCSTTGKTSVANLILINLFEKKE